MRDYFLGSTYRKDVLQGALWQDLRHQLTGVAVGTPGPVDPAALKTREGEVIGLEAPFPCFRAPDFDPSVLGPQAALSTILAYAFGVMRWEPLNPNPEHRTCPSPGSRFTIDANLSVESGRGQANYRYLARDHALLVEAGRTASALASDEIHISLACVPARCASPYGDLAYCLTAIELGANLSQLLLILGMFGLRLDDVRLHGACQSEEFAAAPGLSGRITAPAIADWLRHVEPEQRLFVDQEYPPIKRGAFPLFDALIDGVTIPAGMQPFPGGMAAGPKGGERADLLMASATRSSGLNLQAAASVNRPPRKSSAVRLLDRVAALRGSFTGVERHAVRADVTSAEHARAALSGRWEAGDGSTLSVNASAGDGKRGGDDAYPSGAIVVTISADYQTYVARFGGLALFHIYLAAGIDAQLFCLASAMVGLVCRPMRSFDHATADAALPIEYWSVLQLVIYADGAINPAFPIGGAIRNPVQ